MFVCGTDVVSRPFQARCVLWHSLAVLTHRHRIAAAIHLGTQTSESSRIVSHPHKTTLTTQFINITTRSAEHNFVVSFIQFI
jgi:hypothetical protein